MLYDILHDFKGSQDGRFVEQFVAGTQRELTLWLAAAAPPGSIHAAGTIASGAIENKAIVTDGRHTGALRAKRKNP